MSVSPASVGAIITAYDSEEIARYVLSDYSTNYIEDKSAFSCPARNYDPTSRHDPTFQSLNNIPFDGYLHGMRPRSLC